MSDPQQRSKILRNTSFRTSRIHFLGRLPVAQIVIMFFGFACIQAHPSILPLPASNQPLKEEGILNVWNAELGHPSTGIDAQTSHAYSQHKPIDGLNFLHGSLIWLFYMLQIRGPVQCAFLLLALTHPHPPSSPSKTNAQCTHILPISRHVSYQITREGNNSRLNDRSIPAGCFFPGWAIESALNSRLYI